MSASAAVPHAPDAGAAAFLTPEQQEPRVRSVRASMGRGDPAQSLSAILMDERGDGADDDDAGAHDFAQSHFRRRNRLETRLEELQRDVAKLTTKLRSGSNRSATHLSLDKSMEAAAGVNGSLQESSRVPRASPSSAAKKPARQADISVRKKLASEMVTPNGRINRAQSNSVRTLRELHMVTTERDQLRFELEKAKRSLATIEKKYQDAKRVKQAYEKLKTHCDSLQDSLELSEKIRIRQKKLLQQLQKQLDEQQAQKVDSVRKVGKLNPSRARDGSATPSGKRAKSRDDGMDRFEDDADDPDGAIPRRARADYDILDSLVSPASVYRHSIRDSRPDRHEHAMNTSTPPRIHPRQKPAATSATPSNPYRSEFDKLLRTERPLQSSYTVRRPRQISTQQRLQDKSAPRRAPASARSTTTQPATTSLDRTKRKSPANRPKNSFLAPTQASLNRMHQVTGRHDDQRRPFIP